MSLRSAPGPAHDWASGLEGGQGDAQGSMPASCAGECSATRRTCSPLKPGEKEPDEDEGVFPMASGAVCASWEMKRARL